MTLQVPVYIHLRRKPEYKSESHFLVGHNMIKGHEFRSWISLFVNNSVFTENAAFCEERFEKNNTLSAYFAFKDLESFQNGPVHKLYTLKAKLAMLCKTTNQPYMSTNYENTDQTMTTDLTTNYET